MNLSFEEEVITMLTPKIKSVLRHTTQQNQDDLEQELILIILTTINKNNFSNSPSFFNILNNEKL
jgi:hypothetical protein